MADKDQKHTEHWDNWFPRNHLKALDLKEKAHNVRIQEVIVVEVYNQRIRSKEQARALRFVGKARHLIMKKTLCQQLEKAIGSPDPNQWIGQGICIYPAESKKQADTQIVQIREVSPELTPAPAMPEGAGTY